MSQFETNMTESSYSAYCNAWVFCFDKTYFNLDRDAYHFAVRAGIVFG